jgi:hypothetical protein
MLRRPRRPVRTEEGRGMGGAPLDRKEFVERYARFFGRGRIAAIERLGYLMIEASGEGP